VVGSVTVLPGFDAFTADLVEDRRAALEGVERRGADFGNQHGLLWP
jgi:hypothetical protein